MNKKALIFGITGQDGTLMLSFLKKKGYKVWGFVRPKTNFRHVYNIGTFDGDITDLSSVIDAIDSFQPDEIYNFASLVDVGKSFSIPEYTIKANGLGTLNILEAMVNNCHWAKLFNAGSVALPTSPYGISKRLSMDLVECYRENYGLYAINGILGNHDSPYRNDGALTQKIAKTVARIKYGGSTEKLQLGNMYSTRTWGRAEEYIPYIWEALQRDNPHDFKLTIGTTVNVCELAYIAFRAVGLDMEKHVEWEAELDRNEYVLPQIGHTKIDKDDWYLRKLMCDMIFAERDKILR